MSPINSIWTACDMYILLNAINEHVKAFMIFFQIQAGHPGSPYAMSHQELVYAYTNNITVFIHVYECMYDRY